MMDAAEYSVAMTALRPLRNMYGVNGSWGDDSLINLW